MSFDKQKSEDFAERMIGVLNSGSLALMISIGHRTGLFDTLRGMEHSTSSEIAEKAGLNERYVREWLGAMATGGIVDCDAEGPKFKLPDEHAAFLTREAAPDNIAAFAQYVPLLGSVEDRIIECFEKGGGVPYEMYGRFHEIMAEDSGQTVVAALEEWILPLAEGLSERLEQGIEVLDIACGSGKALNLMSSKFPNSSFKGYDISEEALEYARADMKAHANGNLKFELKDLTEFEETARYDLITAFDAIHDQAAPQKVLNSINRALKPGGTLLMQDISTSSHVHQNVDHPIGPFLYTISCMHCMSVSLAQGGPGLGATWGREKAVEMLNEAGFKDVEIKHLDHDFQNCYYIAKKS